MLTDKCKKDFETWLDTHPIAPYKAIFWDVPLIVQHSYLIQFFDSIEIYINTSYLECTIPFIWEILRNGKIVAKCNSEDMESVVNNTRLEATTAALEKANEIYNK